MSTDSWEKLKDSEKIEFLLVRLENLEKDVQSLRTFTYRIKDGLGRHLNGEGKALMNSLIEGGESQ